MAAEIVGRADYELGTDNTGIKKGLAQAEKDIKASGEELEQTYKSAGYRAGEYIGTGIKTGLKLLGGAAAAAFGIAAKNVIELEQVTADFRAETGATAEEADRAGDAINRMAGRNLQPMKEIGATMAAVTTEMGLTGEAAEDTTQAILYFARATKQDGVGAVQALDAILDGFNLTAEDSQAVMDALVVSHQRYGGSITENQAALAAMAPQLTALNLSWEDGVSLLNMYASAGLDASAGQRALNTAISQLPPGTSLEEFVAHLASIEDPAQRATEAIAVFGPQAGAKMANAIRPGITGLDDFAISAQEAAGATLEAREAMDGTFTNKVRLAINGITSELTGMGKELGPLVTGFASLASLGASLGLDTLLGKFGPKLVQAMKTAGERGADALQEAIQSTGIGAAGTIIGNNIATRIENAIDPMKGSIISKAIGKFKSFGVKVGAVFSIAFTAGAKLAEAVGALLVKLPGSGVVRSAVLTSGMALGGAYGTAVAAGMKLGLVGLTAMIADAIKPQLDRIAADVHESLFGANGPFAAVGPALEGVGDWLNDLPWPLGPKGMPDWARIGAETEEGVKTALVDPTVRAGSDLASQVGPTFARSMGSAKSSVVGAAGEVGSAGASSFVGSFVRTYKGQEEAIKRQGRLAAGAVAQGIVEERAKPRDAWSTMLEMIKHQAPPAQEAAQLLGRLMSSKLQAGLKSGDPAVRAQAEFTKQLMLDRLRELAGQTGPLSGKAASLVAKGLKSRDPEVKAAAAAIKRSAVTPISQIPARAHDYGYQTGHQYAGGMRQSIAEVTAAARALGIPVQKYLQLLSPAEEGPLSEHGGPEGWGKRMSYLYARGIASGVGDVRRAVGSLVETPDSLASRVGGLDWVGPSASSLPGSAAGPINIAGGITIAFNDVDFGSRSPRSVAGELANELRLTLARTSNRLPGAA